MIIRCCWTTFSTNPQNTLYICKSLYETSRPLLLRHGILHPNHENRKWITILMYGCTYYPGSAFLSCPPLIYTLRQVRQLRFATNLHIYPKKHENRCADLHIEKSCISPTYGFGWYLRLQTVDNKKSRKAPYKGTFQIGVGQKGRLLCINKTIVLRCLFRH